MRSTFMGLETSKRGLYTQQSALYTTGHNISNANTPGYSRQRVNMQATAGFPGVGLNAPTMPGFLGTGVEAGSIQRIRDGFVDQQFRGESNKLGYWESRTKAISQMEDVLAEPSKYGLQQSLSDFWQSLQTLATNPENGGARAVVVERGIALADSFNYIHKSLTDIQTNLGQEITVSNKQINSILSSIADLNKQIAEVEPNGYLPNDLYDARDVLVDQLATLLPIETKGVPTGGNALDIADGTLTVFLKLKNGDKVELVKGSVAGELETNPTTLIGANNENLPVEGILIKDANGADVPVLHGELSDTGKLKSLINSYGTNDNKGVYPEMLANLDRMAKEFAKAFNDVHEAGFDLNGDAGDKFFIPKDGAADIGAGSIGINANIIGNPEKVAASSSADIQVGNGVNALELGKVLFNPIPGNPDGLDGFSVQSFYAGVLGELGVQGERSVKMTENSMTLLGAVSNRRDSISSVSLDEEMTDMIRFQQAYNASARMVTVIDETLDKIINGMGVVGR